MRDVYLTQRTRQIVQALLSRGQSQSVGDLASELGISQRSLYYGISEINDWLAARGFSAIRSRRKQGFSLDADQKQRLAEFLEAGSGESSFVPSQEQRLNLMLCRILFSKEAIYAQDFSELCDVSRSTVFSDLRQIEESLKHHGLRLGSSRQEGYRVRGSQLVCRSVYLHALDMLLESLAPPELLKHKLADKHSWRIDDIHARLKAIESDLNLLLVGDILYCLAFLLNEIADEERSQIFIEAEDIRKIKASSEYKAVARSFPEFPEEEQLYISMHFLASRIQQPSHRAVKSEILVLARDLLREFERIAFIFFENSGELIQQIAQHLHTSYYRLKYGIQIGNPLLKRIKLNYPELFELSRDSCKVLERYYMLSVNEDEIAYITLYFGGSVQKSSKAEYVRVLIICPNGLATAQMLKAEVEAIHPSIKVMGVIPSHQLNSMQAQADLIISTIDLDTVKPNFKVNVLLSQNDRLRILNFVLGGLLSTSGLMVQLDEIMLALAAVLTEEQLPQVREILKAQLFPPEIPQDRRNMKHLWDLLPAAQIRLASSCKDWQEALWLAAEPLIQLGHVDPLYVDEIRAQIEKHGKYMHIAPGFILGHAETDGHVRELGLSLLRLGEAIRFFEEDVHSIMILATRDRSSHLGVMKDLLDLLQREEIYERFCAARSVEEIQDCIGQIKLLSI